MKWPGVDIIARWTQCGPGDCRFLLQHGLNERGFIVEHDIIALDVEERPGMQASAAFVKLACGQGSNGGGIEPATQMRRNIARLGQAAPDSGFEPGAQADGGLVGHHMPATRNSFIRRPVAPHRQAVRRNLEKMGGGKACHAGEQRFIGPLLLDEVTGQRHAVECSPYQPAAMEAGRKGCEGKTLPRAPRVIKGPDPEHVARAQQAASLGVPMGEGKVAGQMVRCVASPAFDRPFDEDILVRARTIQQCRKLPGRVEPAIGRQYGAAVRYGCGGAGSRCRKIDHGKTDTTFDGAAYLGGEPRRDHSRRHRVEHGEIGSIAVEMPYAADQAHCIPVRGARRTPDSVGNAGFIAQCGAAIRPG